MALIVQKYGGTSMGSPERIREVAKRIAHYHQQGHQLVVVPSAMSGETNRLLGLAKELSPASSTAELARELDMIASTGEQVSSGLLAIALQAEGLQAVSYAGWQVPISTDTAYTKARISSIDDRRVRADLAAGKVVVITGFQGVDPQGNITTLGRGGSDTSAVAVAAALKAAECLIYTDVDGVYTTDPRVVPEARRLQTITFEEMLEMASLGSKVLQIRSVEFAGKYRVPLRVLSSFTPWDIDLGEEARSGTLITFEEDEKMEQAIVSGIAFNRDEAKISLLGVTDKPGIAFQILGPVAEANIDVDVIIQNVSHGGRTDFSFTVHRNDYARTIELLKRSVLPVTGAADLVVTELLRLQIAAQACILILQLGVDSYDGWNDIVVYPAAFRPRRTFTDAAGVVHNTTAILSGEAWLGGPVVLSHAAITRASDGDTRHSAHNVVIHEFAHKLDMRNGNANGFPPLHRGMQKLAWQQAFMAAYLDFCQRVDRASALAHTDGGAAWRTLPLDAYAAENPAEFFAVMSEAFFTTPADLKTAYPAAYAQLVAFYRQNPLAYTTATQS